MLRFTTHTRENDVAAKAIYASKNGWFAISIGDVPNTGSDEFMAALVRRGSIPLNYSYCSTGEAYISVA